MKMQMLDAAISEAERFLKKAKDCRTAFSKSAMASIVGCPESSATKRSSMDLTRALANLRNK